MNKMGTDNVHTSRSPDFEQNQQAEITSSSWKTRSDRSVESKQCSGRSWSPFSIVRRVLFCMFADMIYALGKYRGGGLLGKPLSTFQLARTSLCNSAVTRKSTEYSEGNESTVENSQLTEEKKEEQKRILSKMRGHCNMAAVRFLGWFLSKLWRICFNKIYVNSSKVRKVREELNEAAKEEKAVLLLPTHRSHIDYLLLSYVCFGYDLPIPHIASGINLNIPVIGPLFAAAGAFFMKRSFKTDELYKKTLFNYILYSLRKGKAVEFFVQGGRTRTGQISEPKLGLVSMVVRMIKENKIEDAVIFPMSVDYDRVLESEGYAQHLLGHEKKSESLIGTIHSGFSLLNTPKHGNVYVNFGNKLSMREIIDKVNEEASKKKKIAQIPDYTIAVGKRIVQEHRNASTISYSMLVATVMLSLSDDELASDVRMEKIKERASWLRQLLLKARPDIESRFCFSEDKNESNMLEHACKVLQPIFAPLKRLNQSGMKRRKASLFYRHRVAHPHGQGDGEADELIQALAKLRLRLRYSAGQLPVLLAPFAVAGTALQAYLLEKRKLFPFDTDDFTNVSNKAQDIAGLVHHHIAGAELGQKSLKESLNLLCEDLQLQAKTYNDFTMARMYTEEKLRILYVVIAPAINASYALLLSLFRVIAPCNHPSTEKALIENCRRTIMDQFSVNTSNYAQQVRSDVGSEMTGTSESTDIFSVDEDEGDEFFGIGLTEISMSDEAKTSEHDEWREMIVSFGFPFPETLSTVEISASIKYLVKSRILEKHSDAYTSAPLPILSRSLSSTSSVIGNLSEITAKESMANVRETGSVVEHNHVTNAPVFEIEGNYKDSNGELIWNKLMLLRSYTSPFKAVASTPMFLGRALERESEKKSLKETYSTFLGSIFNSYTLITAFAVSQLYTLLRRSRLHGQTLES